MADARLDDYAAPLGALRDSYAGGDPAWPTIRELEYDPIHRLVLDLARCCFASLNGQTMAPMAFALDSAMQTIGVEAGPRLFARVLAVVQSLEAERHPRFQHLTVHCARITPDERAFMIAVAMARVAPETHLLRATMTLAATDACPATFATLEVLGAECAELERISPLAQATADVPQSTSAH